MYLPEHGSVTGTLVSAAEQAAADGHPVRAVLLTNPNNPLVGYQALAVPVPLCSHAHSNHDRARPTEMQAALPPHLLQS